MLRCNPRSYHVVPEGVPCLEESRLDCDGPFRGDAQPVHVVLIYGNEWKTIELVLATTFCACACACV